MFWGGKVVNKVKSILLRLIIIIIILIVTCTFTYNSTYRAAVKAYIAVPGSSYVLETMNNAGIITSATLSGDVLTIYYDRLYGGDFKQMRKGGYGYDVISSNSSYVKIYLSVCKGEQMAFRVSKRVDKTEYEIGSDFMISSYTPPTLSASVNDTLWTTSKYITITAKGGSTSLVSLIVNATSIAVDTTSYKIGSNGSYVIKATDEAGSTVSTTINVSKIDSTEPKVTLSLNGI